MNGPRIIGTAIAYAFLALVFLLICGGVVGLAVLICRTIF